MTLRPGRGNRRARTPLRERVPAPREVVDACGRALRRVAPAVAALALIGGVAEAGRYGYRWLTTSPRFAVAAVEVNGEATLTEDAVRARLPFGVGDNIFRVDTGDAEAALAAEPWIARATVRRRLPRTIVIDVVERRPAAVVAADGLYLADADGQPFKRADLRAGEARDLPVISGIPRELFAAAPGQAAARVRDGLAVLTAWSEADRPRAGEVKLGASGATIYTYDDAIAVRIGAVSPTALTAHLARFDAVWAALSPDERRTLRTMRVDNDTRTDLVTVSFETPDLASREP
ncbi:MAG: FtsQ-type POTRA domain-containing protein [Myxococcales bacterium]|nr:FtsQ-type POTRA domain-containing protein [Myxococcales bacterium]